MLAFLVIFFLARTFNIPILQFLLRLVLNKFLDIYRLTILTNSGALSIAFDLASALLFLLQYTRKPICLGPLTSGIVH